LTRSNGAALDGPHHCFPIPLFAAAVHRRLSSMALRTCLRDCPRWLGSSPNTRPKNFFTDPGRIYVGGIKKVDAELYRAPDKWAAFLLFQVPLDLQRMLLRG